MSFIITELSPEQRNHVSNLVIGQTTCPECLRTNIKVLNNTGSKGNLGSYYLENHYSTEENKDLCVASRKFLLDFIK